jgi:hypothetical protein
MLLNECHRVVHIREVSGIFLSLETQQVGSSNNTSDLYSVGAWFKPEPGHWLSSQVFMILLSSPKQMLKVA